MNRTKRTEAEQQALLAYLREHYEYEPKSGGIKNKRRGIRLKPIVSGTCDYSRIDLHFKGRRVSIVVHRFVWAVCRGEWPKGPIDHINNDRTDNHIENLRVCSYRENELNKIHPWKPNKDTGLPGVIISGNNYRTRINGNYYSFRSPYEAFYYATLCGKMYANN